MIFRRGSAREGGAAAVELALTAPLLLLIFAGAVDLGLSLLARSQMHEAAQEGLSVVLREPSDTALARSRAIDAMSVGALTPDQIDIRCEEANRRAHMTVTYEHDPILLPAFLPGLDQLNLEIELRGNLLTTENCQELVS